MRVLTRAEVLTESARVDRDLVIIGERVYDLTTWVDRHPGGRLPIRLMRGRDATDVFTSTHPVDVRKRYLHVFEYGTLSDACPSELEVDFRELTAQFVAEGLFSTDPMYYVMKMTSLLVLLALVVWAVVRDAHPVLSGMGLGLFWQQIAFIGHDLGHCSVSHVRDADTMIGMVCGNLLGGISLGWWKRSHNVHHIVTNSVENDPDIQHLPVFAVTDRYLSEPVYSTFYSRILPLNALARCLCRYQHWLYYPVMAVARFNLYAQSLLYVFAMGPYKAPEIVWHRSVQQASLVLFWVWHIALIMHVRTWPSRLVFVLVSHALAGLLHVQITLSHFSMPTYAGVTYTEHDNGFVLTQLRHSMNVSCSPYMDWLHGGLQFQVEHHLWPRLPRHNLRTAQARLRALVEKHNLPYEAKSFWNANLATIRKLRQVSMSQQPGAPSISTIFLDGLNLFG